MWAIAPLASSPQQLAQRRDPGGLRGRSGRGRCALEQRPDRGVARAPLQGEQAARAEARPGGAAAAVSGASASLGSVVCAARVGMAQPYAVGSGRPRSLPRARRSRILAVGVVPRRTFDPGAHAAGRSGGKGGSSPRDTGQRLPFPVGRRERESRCRRRREEHQMTTQRSFKRLVRIADGEDRRELYGRARVAAQRGGGGAGGEARHLRRSDPGADRPRLGGVVRPARRVGRAAADAPRDRALDRRASRASTRSPGTRRRSPTATSAPAACASSASTRTASPSRPRRPSRSRSTGSTTRSSTPRCASAGCRTARCASAPPPSRAQRASTGARTAAASTSPSRRRARRRASRRCRTRGSPTARRRSA